MSQKVWGDEATQFFFSLSPEKILQAVESIGFRCTGRVLPLNSMENRVYEVEIEVEEVKSPSDRFVIVKFYRPGRWTREQIQEEHEFLRELEEAEIEVVPPLVFQSGSTLSQIESIFFSVFPKRGGRAPDEIQGDDLVQVGRLLGRVHAVGRVHPAVHRMRLSPLTYGLENLRYLIDGGHIPLELKSGWTQTVEAICQLTEPWFGKTANQRIHGDCHLGNLLKTTHFRLIDFDDFVMGPPVQDFWLLIPGLVEKNQLEWEMFLEGYEQMSVFDHSSLGLIEPLRALRFVHFSAWIAKRWEDPAFPKYFPAFGAPAYWNERLADLNDQLALIKRGVTTF